MSARSDRAAEQALLAACLVSGTARTEARKHLTGRDFDDPRHETVWNAIGLLDRHRKPVEAATVMAAVRDDSRVVEILPDLVTTVAVPDSVAEYAAIVRAWSVKRQVEQVAGQALTDARREGVPPVGFAAQVASRFAAIRDGALTEDITGVTVTELLAQTDDEPEWLVPGLLERRDRLMLTGEEGLGKSHTLRQIALHAAAGLHPFFDRVRFAPIKATIIDCENTWSQVRRKVRPMVEHIARRGESPADRVVIDCTTRMDITRDRDLSRIHQLLDAQQPDLVVIGPLYRLVPRALQTDDDAAPVLAALDTIRDRGCAVLIEAHAGHGHGGAEGRGNLRPRGSSALLGWPEFGYGMKNIGSVGYCDLVPWRGQREERDWPQRLRRADGFRWMPVDYTPLPDDRRGIA